jgi:hypothetical protein
MHFRRVIRERREWIGNRRQVLDIEIDCVCSVLRLLACIGEDDGNRLADVTNLVHGQRMIGDWRLEERVRRHRWHRPLRNRSEIGHRVDRRDARHVSRLSGFDAANAPMRDLRAHEGSVEHAGE